MEQKQRKPWKELTTAEVTALKAKQCTKCKYKSFLSGNTKGYEAARITCDYILITGHSRGCDPRDCVEMGIFQPGKKKCQGNSAWRVTYPTKKDDKAFKERNKAKMKEGREP